MTTDQEFEREWEQVKRELSKLEGRKIPTVPKGELNEIVEVSDKRGFMVKTGQTEGDAKRVSWNDVEDRYRRLSKKCILYPDSWYKANGSKPPKGSRGSFLRALLARLSTVSVGTEDNRTVLRYMTEGRPPRLKDSHVLPEPDRQP